MSRTTTLLCRLLATTAIVAVAGNLAFGQEQQKTQEGDVVTKTVRFSRRPRGSRRGPKPTPR